MHPWANILLAGVGGFVGSAACYAVSLAIRGMGYGGKWPWATLAVNVIGCLLIGFLWSRTTRLPQPFVPLAVAGFCGGFTTFSAFSLETVELLRTGEQSYAKIQTKTPFRRNNEILKNEKISAEMFGGYFFMPIFVT